MIYNVVIVGAGPAGSSAAYDLATAGARVLIVDKACFPREKPCGGGLTVKTLKALRFDVSDIVCQVCDHISLSNNFHQIIKDKASGPLSYMTIRRDFDQFCLDQALKAGAEFAVMNITDINFKMADRVVLISEDATEIEASFVVAADGSKSRLRHLMMPDDKPLYAFAVEGKAAFPKDYDPHCLTVDFFVMPHGYGWIFPKKDHVNIGIGSFKARKEKGKKISKASLLEYCQKKLGHKEIYDMIGYPLAGGGDRNKMSQGRVLFVGDAAGTVDALMGEGIYNAICSGQKAAQAILEAQKHNNCPQRLQESFENLLGEIRQDLSFCTKIGRLFYGFPSLAYLTLRSSYLRRRLMERFVRGRTVSGKIGSLGKVLQ